MNRTTRPTFNLEFRLESAQRELLSAGYPTVEQGARRVGVSVRTLQRRLHRNGLTYSRLVEHVRHEEARRLLRSTAATSRRLRCDWVTRIPAISAALLVAGKASSRGSIGGGIHSDG